VIFNAGNTLGAASSQLSVTGFASPLTVGLTGTGVLPFYLSPTSLAFVNEGLNVPSASKTVTIYNYSGVTVTPTIPAADPTGMFTTAGTSACANLATSTSCNFTVIFTPNTTGAISSQLSVTGFASPLTVGLTGTGVQPFSLSPTSLAFGSEGLNVPSTPQTVTIYNYSGKTLTPTIPAADPTGLFTTAPGTLSCANLTTYKSCNFTVIFTPNTTGAISSQLSVTGFATPLSLPLTGTGVQPFYLSATSLAFVNEGLNVPSVAKTVTIYNYSGNTLTPTIPAADPTGMFTTTGASTCANLATNKSCIFSVTFNPGNTLGAISSQLSVTGFASPLTVSLTGTGVQPFYLSPTSLAFGNQGLNLSSAAKTVTIYNYSGNTLTPTIPATDPTGLFTTTGASACANLATNKSCIFSVIFNPGNSTGAISSQLSVTGFATPLTVGLTGTGVQPLYLSPTSLAFGSQAVGSKSASQTVYLYNYSGGTVTPSISSSVGAFTASAGSCANLVLNNGYCSFTMIFAPTVTGATQATLNVGGTSLSLTLTGTGK
jgi:hypothetical protein